MNVRLGFAIASSLDPYILLIDEVLAVGDVEFRAKCYNKIAELMENCAVIIVSHNMPSIARVCSKCIVINKGHSIFHGSAENAIQQYLSIFDEGKINMQGPIGSGEAKIENLKIYGHDGQENEEFQYGKSVTISFDVTVSAKYKNFVVSISVSTNGMQLVAQCHSGFNEIVLKNNNNTKKIQVNIPELLLNPGKYVMNIIIFNETSQKYLTWYYGKKNFSVLGGFVGGANIQLRGIWDIS